ncbi:MAG TPA: hypothetical protein VEL03_02910 [Streptosporangiaceae bacterium]|nr:hypothetical protein [Streptosporangiaceae bacterium]
MRDDACPDATVASVGPAPGRPASSAAATQTDPGPAGWSADPAGWLLRLLTALPMLLAMAWLLAGLPLLLLREFKPAPMLIVALPLAAALVTLTARWLAARPAALPGADRARTPWWPVIALTVVAVGFGVDQAVYHSQQIIVQRDPASYIQFGYWIARHGSLPIPQDAAAFGGGHHALSFYSAAFYPVGHAIVPQFMAGLPMTLAAALWAGGISAAVMTGAVLGACGVLTLGGLVARLVGPRWAPLAALVLALSLPEQFTSRSTYSEPLAQILFLGGLCLIAESLRPEGIGSRGLAALGGLALGLTVLVRIDGISDLLPLIPYCGLLLLGRRRQAPVLIGGLVVGGGLGLVDGAVLSRPYLSTIKGSLLPLIFIAALLSALTAAFLLARWRRGLPGIGGSWLPNAAAATALAVIAGLAIRPYVQTVRGNLTAEDRKVIASFQRLDHLPVDPTRLYYEISLHWVFWYLGVPVVLLATLGAAALARRCVRGREPTWTLPLMCFGWIIVATLLRPAVLPDQPWASRRLVPGVLPGFIVLAVWAVWWLAGWLRRHGIGAPVRVVVVALLAMVLLVPAAKTSFGLKLEDGAAGIRIAAVGLADKTTFRGEIAAVDGMCSAIPGDASVVILSRSLGNQMAEVVRGMCGLPAATVAGPRLRHLRAVIDGIRRAGRAPVLLATSRSDLSRYGGTIRCILLLRTRIDEHALTEAPLGTLEYRFVVWMSRLRADRAVRRAAVGPAPGPAATAR